MHSDLHWDKLIETFAAVPDFPSVYVLGCFAKRVTLYSQQVRAFNLAYGLHKTGRVPKTSRVAILGAGAAGLSAAAAFGQIGCEVLLLEANDSLISLQRNAKHRWLHPFIADWPDFADGDEAQLPILNWRAGSAADVAKQIETAWKASERSAKVTTVLSASKMRLTQRKGTPSYNVHWCGVDHEEATKEVDAIILATGFGLEKTNDYSISYWSMEDGLDDNFVNRINERWLVSGTGDGAFADLMRCCFRDFDYPVLITYINLLNGGKGLSLDIKEIYEEEQRFSNNDRIELFKSNCSPSDADLQRLADISSERLSKAFHQLSLEGFEEFTPLLKATGPEVFLTGKKTDLYGHGASILNRLIVLILARLGAFTFLPGPVAEGMTKITKGPQKGKIEVTLPYPAGTKSFDRVILRHGTNPNIGEIARSLLTPNALVSLELAWKRLPATQDVSGRPRWPQGFFGPEGPKGSTKRSKDKDFVSAVDLYGVKIERLRISKDLREDGGSTIVYAIENLIAIKQPIRGVHFYYDCIAGKVGTPIMDDLALRRGLRWQPDEDAQIVGEDPMATLRQHLRQVSGTIWFPEELVPNAPPLNFSFKIEVLNGNAFTPWEFEQLYEMKDRRHIDGIQLRVPTEYFPAYVWCPVEELALQVSFPQAKPAKVSYTQFRIGRDSPLLPEQTVQKSILHLNPSRESVYGFESETDVWERPKSENPPKEIKFELEGSKTWNFTVTRPEVGSAFTIDWKLQPGTKDENLNLLAGQARNFRSKMVRYVKRRGSKQEQGIRKLFDALRENLLRLERGMGNADAFDLALMTYDETTRRIVFIDGLRESGEPMDDMDDTWFPFGLGLAGACLKQGDSLYTYFRDLKLEPEYYIRLPQIASHRAMIALPIRKSDWEAKRKGTRLEASRMCLGVLNISFSSSDEWLKEIAWQPEREEAFLEVCQSFSDGICRLFD